MGTTRPAGAVDACVAALARHQLAREHGAVALSVLADDDARQGWRQFLAGARRGEVVTEPGDVEPVLRAWLVAADAGAIAEASRHAASSAAAVPAGSLSAHFAFRGERQRADWIADWALTPALRLAAWLCEGAADGERRSSADAPMPRAETAEAVAAWLGGEAAALTILAGGDLATAARCAAAIAHALPSIPVALSATGAALAAYLAQANESTSKALVRQGLVGRAQRGDADDDADEPGKAMGRDPLASPSGGPTPALLYPSALPIPAPFPGPFSEPRPSANPSSSTGRSPPRHASAIDPDEPGRSAVERMLFTALEADDRTRGRFALCATVELDFGGRPAEIDLLAVDARVAVEVDGYFHFRDPDAYRRDRRKDLVLQRGGYLVARFLADDVVSNLDGVVATIADLIDHGSRPGGPTAPPDPS